MWSQNIGDSISQCTDTWFNVDFKIWKESGKDTGVISESKSEIELPTCGSGSHSCSSSILKKG